MNDHYRTEPVRVERRRSHGFLIFVLLVIIAALVAYQLGLFSVHQTEAGKMPEISVNGGHPPGFSLDTAKVTVSTQNKTVSVPHVDVGMDKQSVPVPVVAVSSAK